MKVTARKQFKAHIDDRGRIAQLNRILERFHTEEGFEEYTGENGGIGLSVGLDDASVWFDPYTWDLFEQFLKENICHIIEEEELDKFPYYADMRDRYAADLVKSAGEFTY